MPVAVTFGGPSELDYLWQIDPIYEAMRVERSLLYPRISATFVEEKIRRAAEKVGLWPDGILRVRRALEDYSPEGEDDPRIAGVEAAGRAFLDAVGQMEDEAGRKWLAKSRAGLAFHVEKIVNRLREEKLEAAGLGRKRLERIADAVLPEGKPQERVANIVQFLNLYGPEFVERVIETLDPFSLQHQVVAISTVKEEP